ncbi:Uncharacterised protein [Mycobacterium tuberculosis]|nr:Uncharacterised protein [Mycobacterium tuberculosis]
MVIDVSACSDGMANQGLKIARILVDAIAANFPR